MADKEIPRNRWNVGGGSSSLGHPVGSETFLYSRNSNQEKRTISKVHKNGSSQSKMA
jgi:hypothetical protein